MTKHNWWLIKKDFWQQNTPTKYGVTRFQNDSSDLLFSRTIGFICAVQTYWHLNRCEMFLKKHLSSQSHWLTLSALISSRNWPGSFARIYPHTPSPYSHTLSVIFEARNQGLMQTSIPLFGLLDSTAGLIEMQPVGKNNHRPVVVWEHETASSLFSLSWTTVCHNGLLSNESPSEPAAAYSNCVSLLFSPVTKCAH